MKENSLQLMTKLFLKTLQHTVMWLNIKNIDISATFKTYHQTGTNHFLQAKLQELKTKKQKQKNKQKLQMWKNENRLVSRRIYYLTVKTFYDYDVILNQY